MVQFASKPLVAHAAWLVSAWLVSVEHGVAAEATCRSKDLKALWTADSDGAAGRTGRRSSMTSEAGHAGGTVTSDY